MWSSGAAYETYIGRWSHLVAREFINWLAIPSGRTWLDVGCGTGALTQTILAHASPSYIISVDSSNEYVDYLREHVNDARLCFDVRDAQDLQYRNESYDVIVSGLVLNFVPEPERAVAEMARVVKRDGTVALYLWDYTGEMQLIRYFWDAACDLDKAACKLDEGVRFPICKDTALAKVFRHAGLRQVETRAIDVPTVFRDFDDFWTPFLGGQGPAPSYAMSLTEDRRALLRESLYERLPIKSDGSIHLIARAWAVRGTR